MLTSSTRRSLFGRRYLIPSRICEALQYVLGASVADVIVVEHSCYARAHVGMAATTRPGRIWLAISGKEFVSSPEMLLHEYFHVLRQWRTGDLTRWKYLIESARFGYWNNRFEQEAREFTSDNVERYLERIQGGIVTDLRRPDPQNSNS